MTTEERVYYFAIAILFGSVFGLVIGSIAGGLWYP